MITDRTADKYVFPDDSANNTTNGVGGWGGLTTMPSLEGKRLLPLEKSH